MNDIEKEEWLKLTEGMQSVLRVALNSLGGKMAEGLHQQFSFYSAAHLNRAVQGYVVLSRNGMPQSAVLLVRPALEAMFRLLAVRKDPAVVCRIAASEKVEEEKMLRSFGTEDGKKALAILANHWEEFKRKYSEKYPEHSFSGTTISLFELAKSVGLEEAYNTHYRLYCKFTHAALRAAVGGFDEVIERDRPTMAACAGVAVDSLIPFGATVDGYPELQRKFNELDAQDRRNHPV